MENSNGGATVSLVGPRVDTTGVFLDVFGERTEFSTFEEFSDLFVRFEKKSRYIFRVKNSSSVEAENRRRKDKIDSAIKYSGLVLCCVNCGDASKTIRKVQEGDSRQLCDAHIYLRYRSSSRKLAIISSSFVHNHHSQAGNGIFHRKQSVTERIGKPRDGRRKFVKAGDKMGKLTRPILPNLGHVIRGSSELTIIPLGIPGGAPPLDPVPRLAPPRPESAAYRMPTPNAAEHGNSGKARFPPPALQHCPENSLVLLPTRGGGTESPHHFLPHLNAEPPGAAGSAILREAKRFREDCNSIDLRRILEPECILHCYDDDGAAPADDAGSDSTGECTATDLSVRPRQGAVKVEVPIVEVPENLSVTAVALQHQREYTVTWKELEPLFRFCSRCGAPVEKTRHSLHNVLSVSAVCQRGHGVFWTSRS